MMRLTKSSIFRLPQKYLCTPLHGKTGHQAKRPLLSVGLFLFLFLSASAEPIAANHAESKKDCSENCFSSEIVQIEASGKCFDYQLKITHDGNCHSALSHYTVATPCGNVQAVSNSGGWLVETEVLDPTTQLYGFKIDDIAGFGEANSEESFTVNFTVCADNEDCFKSLSCWEPVVAYKAGQCVNYDTLKAKCNPLVASIVKNDISCFGGSDGWAKVEIESGEGPFSYSWSNGGISDHIDNVNAGSYEVKITDGFKNEVILSTVINEPEEIILNFITGDASCGGVDDGSIDLEVEGGVAPYTYSWSNGVTTQDLAGIAAGYYTVTVTDADGCTSSGSVSIEDQVTFVIGAEVQNATCVGKSDGYIDIFVTGGKAPYSYSWSNGETTEDIKGLEGGFYIVDITDAAGCTIERAYYISYDSFINVQADVTKTGCIDDGTGAIDISVTGGTEPYSFLWSNGATTEDINNLAAGNYNVEITDANGCTHVFYASVTEAKLAIDYEVTAPSCVGMSDGSIDVTIQNGSGSYTYQWSTGETTEDLDGLSQGLYELTVTDEQGCTVTRDIFLPDPFPLQVQGEVTGDICADDDLSDIDITVSGGTEPFEFSWSNGEVTEDLTGVSPGNYNVKVTDANGCETSATFTVEQGNAADLSCLINNPESTPQCLTEGNTLSAQAVGAGSYEWSVISNDNSWSITSGNNTPEIIYTAGNANTEATFILKITNEDGCTATCELTLSACVDTPGSGDNNDGGGDDNGGGDDGNDDGGNDDGNGDDDPDVVSDCTECFNSDISRLSHENDCNTYQITVTNDGHCAKALSHFTVAIPCGEITSVTNSEGWPMETRVLDPKTGLYGFKVDDIHGFGEASAASSFDVSFTLCTTDSECGDVLKNWSPVVAYKAGQCIMYDTLTIDNQVEGLVNVYPNPFSAQTKISFQPMETGHTVIEIYNNVGEKVVTVWEGDLLQGQNYEFDIKGSEFTERVYYYTIRSGSLVISGKMLNLK